ncbi:MAG TPA: FtsW/RodA/SpoVE family cell cycle protein [Candidatus Absconditabacterales bacterium]|nr:FtsW/RodA/SpoVE family cell cycle protein [Candidatus Absconditabacterales bacterium]HNG96666.1 FtsW/RodA/SpoVE family cell cycle protein [Candidatus Absconditabacterales bacterium]
MTMGKNTILMIGLFLILYGLGALFSVSIHESFTLTLLRGEPSNYFYFFKQLRNIVVGLVVAFIVYKTSLSRIRSWRYIILIGVVIITALLLTPLGIELNGARLWLEVPLVGTLQPGEFFKLGFVLLICDWLVRKKALLHGWTGFFSFLVVTGLSCAIFLVLKDNGTILILGLTALILYRYLGGKKRFVVIMMILGLGFGILIGTQVGYVKARFQAFLYPEADSSGRGITYQIRNALASVGGGGLIGKGYGKGIQKFGYIPEAQSDYIFAAFSEEVGFVGNILLITLYLRLAVYVLTHLKIIRDDYLRGVGMGILSLIMIQAFINIGVNINIIPSTGLTLPFVSFGGTAIMVNMIELILLHKIITEGKELKRLY